MKTIDVRINGFGGTLKSDHQIKKVGNITINKANQPEDCNVSLYAVNVGVVGSESQLFGNVCLNVMAYSERSAKLEAVRTLYSRVLSTLTTSTEITDIKVYRIQLIADIDACDEDLLCALYQIDEQTLCIRENTFSVDDVATFDMNKPTQYVGVDMPSGTPFSKAINPDELRKSVDI